MVLLLVLSYDLQDWPMDKHYISGRYSANTKQRTFPIAIFHLLFLLTTEFYLKLHCVEDTVLFKNKQTKHKNKQKNILSKFSQMYPSV